MIVQSGQAQIVIPTWQAPNPHVATLTFIGANIATQVVNLTNTQVGQSVSILLFNSSIITDQFKNVTLRVEHGAYYVEYDARPGSRDMTS